MLQQDETMTFGVAVAFRALMEPPFTGLYGLCSTDDEFGVGDPNSLGSGQALVCGREDPSDGSRGRCGIC